MAVFGRKLDILISGAPSMLQRQVAGEGRPGSVLHLIPELAMRTAQRIGDRGHDAGLDSPGFRNQSVALNGEILIDAIA